MMLMKAFTVQIMVIQAIQCPFKLQADGTGQLKLIMTLMMFLPNMLVNLRHDYPDLGRRVEHKLAISQKWFLNAC